MEVGLIPSMGKISLGPFRVGILIDEIKKQGKCIESSPFSILTLACDTFNLASQLSPLAGSGHSIQGRAKRLRSHSITKVIINMKSESDRTYFS